MTRGEMGCWLLGHVFDSDVELSQFSWYQHPKPDQASQYARLQCDECGGIVEGRVVMRDALEFGLYVDDDALRRAVIQHLRGEMVRLSVPAWLRWAMTSRHARHFRVRWGKQLVESAHVPCPRQIEGEARETRRLKP